MAKLDAANYFLRTMRAQMSEPNPSPFKVMALDELASALLAISLKGFSTLLFAKDKKFRSQVYAKSSY